ncbi:glycosyltransferase family 2 protein [Acidipila sp. EB88]|uniref:glycosyltransferase family 2 protein n=1 Tax=Acidipila sp. EB88 TaxID=2305226 RepID=UPI000F60066A|nr:glycosyltransferase family A protein [Acidipila sp. EB88]RRA47247.1 glycosyltransferase family 2 protein [Acidipila sp. EB88]
MKLSLVVASVDRTRELHALLAGFEAQLYRDFEVVIVDQNDDDRLVPIVAEFSRSFPVIHLRTNVRNCSNARNLGLFAATGEVVGFPDDDCLYKPDTMSKVAAHFSGDPTLTLLAGNCVSETGELINGRWTTASCEINDKTVWTTVIGFAIWMRTAPAREINGFDPAIGPGTPWGSSEEPDLALRLLRRNYRGYYDVTLGIWHPDKRLTPGAIARAFLYGAGMGRVLRKHSIAAGIAAPYFIRPIGGVVVSLLRRRMSHVRYYWGTFRGRLFGYMAAPSR